MESMNHWHAIPMHELRTFAQLTPLSGVTYQGDCTCWWGEVHPTHTGVREAFASHIAGVKPRYSCQCCRCGIEWFCDELPTPSPTDLMCPNLCDGNALGDVTTTKCDVSVMGASPG